MCSVPRPLMLVFLFCPRTGNRVCQLIMRRTCGFKHEDTFPKSSFSSLSKVHGSGPRSSALPNKLSLLKHSSQKHECFFAASSRGLKAKTNSVSMLNVHSKHCISEANEYARHLCSTILFPPAYWTKVPVENRNSVNTQVNSLPSLFAKMTSTQSAQRDLGITMKQTVNLVTVGGRSSWGVNVYNNALFSSAGKTTSLRFFSEDANSRPSTTDDGSDVASQMLTSESDLEAEEMEGRSVAEKRLTISELEEDLRGVQDTEDRNGIEPLPRRPASDLSLPELSRQQPLTLAPYVNRSDTLQRLVQLGVDLSIVQQVPGIASILVRSKFERDIAPYIEFLFRAHVPAEKLGHLLTVNPHVLTTPIAELELKVGYLVHKRFPLPELGPMLSRAPVILLMSPEQMDGQLAFLQQTFQLSADEVRQTVLSVPRILPFKKDKIALTRFQLKSFLGFEDLELKKILLTEPKIYMTDFRHMSANFEFLQHSMLIPHQTILSFPGVLTHRTHILRNRHMFLLSRGRAQYDPCKENFVSMKSLITGTDQTFCENVAKTDLTTYYDFLKTL